MQRVGDRIERGQFAGHETFPLRLLWLKKVFERAREGVSAGTFKEHEAIARFGVGRNMAASMSFWARASGFFEETDRIIRPTRLGFEILPEEGLDPYLEHPATAWLVHWHIASSSDMTTTAFYAFNGLASLEFDPASLVEELMALVERNRLRATRGTLKRDVEVFLRSYVRRADWQSEDAAEPLLAELGLVREARLGGWFEFVRGPKPTLPDGAFAYALEQFWERQGGSTALTVEQISYEAGSPGRVFKLDEDSLITRLMRLNDLTDGAWEWTDTAGLRQVQRRAAFDPFPLIASDYGHGGRMARAA
jgi:hypothetical protein